MSKKIPFYVSQGDLEIISLLLMMNKARSINGTLPPKQESLFERVQEELMTFEDYENGIRKLEE